MNTATYTIESRAAVLVVDDNQANICALEDALSPLDVDIITATSGEQALSHLIRHTFALALIDVQMPGMDGYELAKLIHADKKTKHLPIIFITAINKDDTNIMQGYSTGAIDYLFKPVNTELLHAKTSIFLELHNNRQQLEKSNTELIEANNQLQHIAQVDALTQMPNRLNFEKLLNRTLTLSRRSNCSCALLFMDIDDFKSINDNYGHQFGDELLKVFAQVIQGVLRENDYAARLGGDEFAIILTEITNVSEAGSIAETILRLLTKKISVLGESITIRASIGIACYPFSGDNTTLLMRNADLAMYRAKANGRNTYAYFRKEHFIEHNQRTIIESALDSAIDNNEFYLAYQPIYHLNTGDIYGFEVLLRWTHPQMGSISPADFIPICEQSGKIKQVGAWVLKTAVSEYIQYCHDQMPNCKICVNLSPNQVIDNSYFSNLISIPQELGLSKNQLIYELTESSLMVQTQYANEILLDALVNSGITVSVDDFGTGFSSLSRLKKLPVRSLKIDASFVSDLENNDSDASIVKTIVSLGKSLSLYVVAEGVETEYQLNLLKTIGCDYAQGFLLSKPVTIDKLATIKQSLNDLDLQ